MNGPIMQVAQNSPIHRSANLLCSNLNGRAERVNSSSLGYFPGPQPHETKSAGERSYSESTTSTVIAPMLAPGRNFQMFHPMDQTAAEYYTDYAPPLPMRTSHPPQQFSGYYPVADNEFVAAAYDPIMATSHLPDTAPDFGAIFYETPVTHQPPLPPAAPDNTVPSNPPFYYHPCRWLGGPRCDGFAPGKNREMGEHLRVFHHFIGHERDTVQCEWENCGHVMQRMNVPRHIVSRHLLAAASCRFCSKRFSRPDVVSRHERTCGGVLPV